MTDETSHPTHGTLTDSQRTRVDFARRDLDYARSEDLEQLREAGLVLLVDKLLGRLDDVLGVIDELNGGQGADFHA